MVDFVRLLGPLSVFSPLLALRCRRTRRDGVAGSLGGLGDPGPHKLLGIVVEADTTGHPQPIQKTFIVEPDARGPGLIQGVLLHIGPHHLVD